MPESTHQTDAIPPISVRLAYASPAFAQALLGVPIFVYLPKFYTDVIGVSLTALGTIFLGGRIFDAISDPLIGAWSDRTRASWGRRRPFILFGALPLALAALGLYIPPDMSAEMSTSWFAAFFFLLFLFVTVVFVPYKALGPELTRSYDGRTSVFALREGFLIVGTLLAASGPAIIGWAMDLGESPLDERIRYATFAAIAIPIMLGSALWCSLKVRERPIPASQTVKESTRQRIKQALKNKPFMILMASYAVTALGSNLPAVLLTYFATYILNKEEMAPFVLGGYFLVGVLVLPLWVKLSQKIGKKAAWLTSIAATTLPFSLVYGIQEGQEMLYLGLVLLAGIGGVAVMALPASMQADVIDYDELRSGARREGLFISLWSVAEKSAYALSVGLALPILEMAGYVANQPQNPEVLDTLRILYVVVPCVCNGIALAIGLLYPLHKDKHMAIIEALEQRMRGESVTDPLSKRIIVPVPMPVPEAPSPS